MGSKTQQRRSRREALREQRAREAAEESRRQRLFRLASVFLSVIVVGIVGVGVWSAQPTTGGPSGKAPGFTLRTTQGTTVSLADYRGRPVVLYFNEGAGCASLRIPAARADLRIESTAWRRASCSICWSNTRSTPVVRSRISVFPSSR